MIAALLFAAMVSPQPSPNPYVIYRQALQRLGTLPQPRYIVETQRQLISTIRNGELRDQTDHTARYVYDSNTRRECGFFLPLSRTDQPFIGESHFPPDLWLLHPNGKPAPTSAGNVTPDVSDIKTIATALAIGRPSYNIRFVGIDTINGAKTYHLALKPLVDPHRHNLRELWIDASNYNIVRAVIEGEYRLRDDDVLADTLVTEDFGDVGGYWLVVHKLWSYYRPFSAITYRFDFASLSMQFPPSVPVWLFDRKAFMAHAFSTSDPILKS